MLPMFQNEYQSNQTINIYTPAYHNINSRLTNNLTTIVSFYRERNKPIKSTSRLLKLANIITPYSILTDYSSIGDGIESAYAATLHTIGIGTKYYPIQLLTTNGLYAEGNVEAWYAESAPFDTTQAWQDYAPIEVMAHPRTDLGYSLTEDTLEKGLVVIRINLAGLHWQIRQFRRHNATLPKEQRVSLAVFFGNYVIPNMIKSHITVAYLNRVLYRLTGRIPAETNNRFKIAIPSTLFQIDDAIEFTLNQLQNRKLRLDTIWDSLWVPFYSKPSTLFYHSNMVWSDAGRLYRWASSLTWLQVILTISYGNDHSANRGAINWLIIATRRFNNERTFTRLNWETDGKLFVNTIIPYAHDPLTINDELERIGIAKRTLTNTKAVDLAGWYLHLPILELLDIPL